MARLKSFDEQSTLRTLGKTFCELGYSATTYQNLQSSTGLTGRSLINAYGDKQDMYKLCLESYLSDVEAERNDCLTPPNCAGILRFFKRLESLPVNDLRQNGCLMVNAIHTSESQSEAVQALISQFRSGFVSDFEMALDADGILHPQQRAQFLTVLLWGCAIEVRLSRNTHAVRPIRIEVDRLLRIWANEANGHPETVR